MREAPRTKSEERRAPTTNNAHQHTKKHIVSHRDALLHAGTRNHTTTRARTGQQARQAGQTSSRRSESEIGSRSSVERCLCVPSTRVSLTSSRGGARRRPEPETSRPQEAQAQGAQTQSQYTVHSKHRAERHDEPHTQARTGQAQAQGTRGQSSEQRAAQNGGGGTDNSIIRGWNSWCQAAHSARAAAAQGQAPGRHRQSIYC